MKEIVIVDYGLGNVKSVLRACEHLGIDATLSAESRVIRGAERLLLPGVGAFADGVRELEARGQFDAILSFAETGRPLLGICLGMQLLFRTGREHGSSTGLGLIPGEVRRIPDKAGGCIVRKVPHVGWSSLRTPSSGKLTGVLQGVSENDYFYFLHSYSGFPDDKASVHAVTVYEHQEIAAVVAKDNIVGCQFHPEKSGPAGLAVLDNFASL